MIEDTMVIEKEEVKYDPLPVDKYQVELLDISVKDATGRFAKPGEKNFVFQFVLLDGKDEEGKELRAIRSVWANFVPTKLQINPRAKKWPGKNELYRIVEALNGEEFVAEQITGKELKGLIGKQCIIFTQNSEPNVDGKVFTNVANYKMISEELPSLTDEEKENAKVKKDKEEPSYEEDPLEEKQEEISVDDIPIS